jgi:Isopropylmalate/homocitrate/citramalate synthases
MKTVELLDCTLRDGAYCIDGKFGAKSIGGIIRNLQVANVKIIECGWLKNSPHEYGTTYYQVPDELSQYLQVPKSKFSTYVAMIDYNQYNCEQLPQCNGETIDAIRIVFPKDKVKEGLALVEPIRKKGYGVYLQAANTLGYSDSELLELVKEVNNVKPDGLAIVDTFGAMYPNDLIRMVRLIHNSLDKNINIGFHAHNNQQLAFSLGMKFIEEFIDTSERGIIIDSSLCGMGRGAGNTPTELLANYINTMYDNNYDMNVIMDAVDMHMLQYMHNSTWGYSIPYSIAGMYCCHVNNVAYLTKTHRTRNKDIKMVFEMLDKNARTTYDYEHLDKIYADYQNKEIDDSEIKKVLQEKFSKKTVLAILPGKTAMEEQELIKTYKKNNNVIVVGINSVLEGFEYDWLFFSNSVKYTYAKENYNEQFTKAFKIISSNIKTNSETREYIVNYNDLQKREWKYYDNSMIMFLRLMSILQLSDVKIAGFDGYKGNGQYAEQVLHPELLPKEKQLLEDEIFDMLKDFVRLNGNKIHLEYITKSPFEII